jgi:hypothetical protein
VFRGRGGCFSGPGGGGTPGITAITAYESFLDKPVDYVLDYTRDNPSTWAQFETACLAIAGENGSATTVYAGPVWGNGILGARGLCLGLKACAGYSIGTGGATWADESPRTDASVTSHTGTTLMTDASAIATDVGRALTGAYLGFPAGASILAVSGASVTMSHTASAGTSGSVSWGGANDAHWTNLGNYLIANGLGSALIRLAREFNYGSQDMGEYIDGVNSRASDPNNIANYLTGYTHILSLLRGLPAANFAFMWNPTVGSPIPGGLVPPYNSTTADVTTAYPGDSYVDSIGLDIYDAGYTALGGPPYTRTSTQTAANFAGQRTEEDGLNDWVTFASAHSKDLSFPEWGLKLYGSGTDYNGGGDNPYFINQMAGLMGSASVSVGMQALWEHLDDGVYDPDSDAGRLMPVPNSRAAFLANFGGGLQGITGPYFFWRGTPVIDGTVIQDFAGNYNATPVPSGGITFGGTGALPMDVMASMAVGVGARWQFPTNGLWTAIQASTAANGYLTLECWVQQSAGNTGAVELIGFYDLQGLQFAISFNAAGEPAGSMTVSQAGATPTSLTATLSSGALNDGNWHYLVWVFDLDATVSFYNDSVLVETMTFTLAGPNPLSSVLPNGYAIVGNSATGFSLQEVAVYPMNISGTGELYEHYAAGGAALLTAQTSGEAIVNGLSLAGIPADVCALVADGGNIDPGLSVVQPPGGGSLFATMPAVSNSVTSQTLTSIDATSYAQTYGTAENGFLFVNPAGVLTFYDRHYPVTGTGTPAATSQATFADTPSSSYFYLTDSFVIRLDNEDLWNEIIGAAQQITGDELCTGSLQTFENLVSQGLYGKRSYPQLTGLLVTTDAAALALCQWVGLIYGTPEPRVEAIKMSSLAGTQSAVGVNLPQMLGRALWDQVTVAHVGLLAGAEFEQGALIEGIDHKVDLGAGVWQTTFHLSPAQVGITYLILNDSTYGTLSTDNCLAY